MAGRAGGQTAQVYRQRGAGRAGAHLRAAQKVSAQVSRRSLPVMSAENRVT